MTPCRFACAHCNRWFEFEASASEAVPQELDCPFCGGGHAKRLPASAPAPKTGSYKYNKKLQRLIKVSDCVPGLSGGGGHNCGSCSGGSCSTCGH